MSVAHYGFIPFIQQSPAILNIYVSKPKRFHQSPKENYCYDSGFIRANISGYHNPPPGDFKIPFGVEQPGIPDAGKDFLALGMPGYTAATGNSPTSEKGEG